MSVAARPEAASNRTPRRPGRRPAARDLRQWDRHYECAGLYVGTNWPMKRIAASFGVCRATAYLWLRLAFAHDDPRAEGLRRLALESRRGRAWLRRLGLSA